MVPLIPLYYVALAIFTVLFANFNPYLTLPQAANKISGYIEASTYNVQHTFAKSHGIDDGWRNAPYVRQVRLAVHDWSSQPTVAAYKDKMGSWLAPVKGALSTFLDPFFAAVAELVSPLSPYWDKAVAYATPYWNKAGFFVRRHLETVYDKLVDAKNDVVQVFSPVVSYFKQEYAELTDYYTQVLVPFYADNNTWIGYVAGVSVGVLAATAAVLLFVQFALPVVGPPIKVFFVGACRDAYELGKSMGTMYNKETVVVVEEDSPESLSTNSRSTDSDSADTKKGSDPASSPPLSNRANSTRKQESKKEEVEEGEKTPEDERGDDAGQHTEAQSVKSVRTAATGTTTETDQSSRTSAASGQDSDNTSASSQEAAGPAEWEKLKNTPVPIPSDALAAATAATLLATSSSEQSPIRAANSRVSDLRREKSMAVSETTVYAERQRRNSNLSTSSVDSESSLASRISRASSKVSAKLKKSLSIHSLSRSGSPRKADRTPQRSRSPHKSPLKSRIPRLSTSPHKSTTPYTLA